MREEVYSSGEKLMAVDTQAPMSLQKKAMIENGYRNSQKRQAFLLRVQPLLVELNGAFEDACDDIQEIDQLTLKNPSCLSAEGVKTLGRYRRVAAALGKRLRRIKDCLEHGTREGDLEACDLLKEELSVPSDPMNALIGSESIPPIAPSLWVHTLALFAKDIRRDMKEVAQLEY